MITTTREELKREVMKALLSECSRHQIGNGVVVILHGEDFPSVADLVAEKLGGDQP